VSAAGPPQGANCTPSGGSAAAVAASVGALVSAFEGVLYDGRTAARHVVTVEVSGAQLSIVSDSVRASLARDAVRVDAPVPGVPRRLLLPGGAAVETEDEAAVEAVWPTTSRVARAAYWLESRVSMALAAIAITGGLVAWIIADVLPLAADPIARSISPEIEYAIGEQALKSLDETYAKPSALPAERREAIRSQFAALTAGEANDVVLEFRRMDAPNALALPGRTVVLTDEMVQFAKNDDELMAVLAHEIGHLRGRHAMRMVLQQSGIAVLVTALAGDAVGMTLLAVLVPAALLNARYSREFELEADAYALALLERHGRSKQSFIDVLRHFAADQRTADMRDPILRYLSSHPDLEERIRRAEAR
jgi:Zn-dependent protease with chaperone function